MAVFSVLDVLDGQVVTQPEAGLSRGEYTAQMAALCTHLKTFYQENAVVKADRRGGRKVPKTTLYDPSFPPDLEPVWIQYVDRYLQFIDQLSDDLSIVGLKMAISLFRLPFVSELSPVIHSFFAKYKPIFMDDSLTGYHSRFFQDALDEAKQIAT